MSLPMTRTNEGVSVLCHNQMYNVRRENPSFKQMMSCINANDADGFVELYNDDNKVQYKVPNVVSGSVSYQNGHIYQNGAIIDDSELDELFSNRAQAHLRDGLGIEPLLKFIENILQNSSYNSRKQGYQFTERNELPITDDGYFLAYKSVRDNYLDKHSGTISNHVGAKVSMNRNLIDDNPATHCSRGLHVGGLKYSGPNGSFNSDSDKVIIVQVNPRDIVCVPNDHECQKCRVCDYTVVGDYEQALKSTMYGQDGQELGPEYFDGYEIEYFDEVEVDDELVFHYTDRHGITKNRRASVSFIDEDKVMVSCVLSEPEQNAGETRCFYWEQMSDVKAID